MAPVMSYMGRTGLDAQKGAGDPGIGGWWLQSTVTYPNTPIGGSLKAIAQVKMANLGTRVFYAAEGGLRHPSEQVKISRPTLERRLGGGRRVLFDLRAHNAADDVVMLIWSEFGRPRHRQWQRTDHGAGGVSLLIGDRSIGMYGERHHCGGCPDARQPSRTPSISGPYTPRSWKSGSRSMRSPSSAQKLFEKARCGCHEVCAAAERLRYSAQTVRPLLRGPDARTTATRWIWRFFVRVRDYVVESVVTRATLETDVGISVCTIRRAGGLFHFGSFGIGDGETSGRQPRHRKTRKIALYVAE